MCSFLIICFVLVNCAWPSTADHWGYPHESANGVVEGAEGWGGVCDAGHRQSPIDLDKRASVLGYYTPLQLNNWRMKLNNAKIHNNGHTLQIDVPANSYFLSGGGLNGVYIMQQMHFHWASEHTLNGKRFGLELHIVFYNDRYNGTVEAIKFKHGVAVVGVLFHVSEQRNLVLKNILDAAESVKHSIENSNEITNPFSPIELFPEKRAFFRYDGSLTTPECKESVLWTVFEQSVPFAMSQIERFKDVKNKEGEKLTHNFRQLQRLNSRPLVYVPEHDSSTIFSGASDVRFTNLTLLIASYHIMLIIVRNELLID